MRALSFGSRLNVLLPMLVGVVACGGNVSSVEGSSSGSSGSSGTSGGTSGSSGGTSGTSGGTSGTSGSSGTTEADIDLCTGPGPTYERLVGVTPAPGFLAVDYMELRDEYAGSGGPSAPPIVIAKEGTQCQNATDKKKCTDSIAAFRTTNGWPITSIGFDAGPRKRYLLWQSQDTVAAELTVEKLRAFVAPIDNPKDAALLVTATDQYRIACEPGLKHAKKTATGWDINVQSGHTCGQGTKLEGHVVAVTSDGAVTLKSTTLIKEGDPNCAIGRRPDGLLPAARCAAENDVGRFFADAAHLEAASVFAFERLERELAALGAPDDLLDLARVSQEDEVRHTRMTTSLAERFGASCTHPAVAPMRLRTAFEIALENAVEGCVRETYGALVAHWQASAAEDEAIAAVMKRIAVDETRHAGLAWDVAAWLEPQLTDDERAAIAAARSAAFSTLHDELAREPAADLVRVAGMPDARAATALLSNLHASLAA